MPKVSAREQARSVIRAKALTEAIDKRRSMSCIWHCRTPWTTEHPTCAAERGSSSDGLGCLCHCHDERLAKTDV